MTFYRKYLKSFLDCILKKTYKQSLVAVTDKINVNTAIHPHLHYYTASIYFYMAIIAMLRKNKVEALCLLDLALINYPQHALADQYQKLLLSNATNIGSKQNILKSLKEHLLRQHLITEFEFDHIAILWPVLKRLVRNNRASCKHYVAALDRAYRGKDLLYCNAIKNYYLDLREDAIADLEKYLKLSPKNAGALSDLGRLLLMQSRYDQAIVVLNKSIKLKTTGNSYFWLGLGYLFADQFDDSLRCFEQAKTILKDEHCRYHHALAELYCTRAYFYHDTRHSDLAFNDLHRVLELNNNDLKALLLRAQMYSEYGNIPDALRDIEQILIIYPQHKQARRIQQHIIAALSCLNEE